jgi:hypothetical protein
MEMELWMMDLQLPVNRTDEKKENEAAAQRIEIEDAKEHTAAALRRTVFDFDPGARGSVTCDRGTTDI